MAASFHNRVDIMEKLLAAGANPNLQKEKVAITMKQCIATSCRDVTRFEE